MTILELIDALQNIRQKNGESSIAAINDADTGWDLAIKKITYDYTLNRVLIGGDYNDVLPSQKYE
jgi:hypothetical protein